MLLVPPGAGMMGVPRADLEFSLRLRIAREFGQGGGFLGTLQ